MKKEKDKIEKEEKDNGKTDNEELGEKNAEKYPADVGKMLYTKGDNEFTGMYYYFEGELVGFQDVNTVFDKTAEAYLVKNSNGYVMPIVPPFEISDIEIGDQINAWGNLSGEGYDAFELDVDNVVGMVGLINAFTIEVNGEIY